jgi:hypothetical protein
MRLEHPAGETLFVDWAGMTRVIFDPQSGKVQQAQIFVAVLEAARPPVLQSEALSGMIALTSLAGEIIAQTLFQHDQLIEPATDDSVPSSKHRQDAKPLRLPGQRCTFRRSYLNHKLSEPATEPSLSPPASGPAHGGTTPTPPAAKSGGAERTRAQRGQCTQRAMAFRALEDGRGDGAGASHFP